MKNKLTLARKTGVFFALCSIICIGFYSCKDDAVEPTQPDPSSEIKTALASIPEGTPKSKVHVFVLMEQSNMVGHYRTDAQNQTWDDKERNYPRVQMVSGGAPSGEALNIVQAGHPLHAYLGKAGVGPGLAFGNSMKRFFADGDYILLLPCAKGSTSSYDWVHDNQNLITRTKQKIEYAKQFGTIEGMLWIQGESDLVRGRANDPTEYPNGFKFAIYQNRVEAVINQIRAVTNPDLPVVIGQLAPGGQAERDNFNTNLVQFTVPGSDFYIRKVRVAHSDGLVTGDDDNTHYDPASASEMGKRLAEKMQLNY